LLAIVQTGIHMNQTKIGNRTVLIAGTTPASQKTVYREAIKQRPKARRNAATMPVAINRNLHGHAALLDPEIAFPRQVRGQAGRGRSGGQTSASCRHFKRPDTSQVNGTTWLTPCSCQIRYIHFVLTSEDGCASFTWVGRAPRSHAPRL